MCSQPGVGRGQCSLPGRYQQIVCPLLPDNVAEERLLTGYWHTILGSGLCKPIVLVHPSQMAEVFVRHERYSHVYDQGTMPDEGDHSIIKTSQLIF